MAGAAAAGIETMVGDILSSNAPMLDFMRALGFSVMSTTEGPEIRRASKRLSASATGAAVPDSEQGSAT